MRRTRHRSPSHWACLLALIGCGASQNTQRVFQGEVVVGPYVEPEAYAAFAEGVYLEQRGDYPGAMSAYRRAQALDGDSPGIAARLGAVTCRSNLAAGLEEFQTSGVARDYAPAWAERALCLHRHADAQRALAAARRALALDSRNPDANLLIAELHREAARPDAARAWLFAWALEDPDAAAHSRAIEAQAWLLGDRALVALARSARAANTEDAEGARVEVVPRGPAELALSATSRGEPDIASRQAALALAANPEDADALVAALFAASALLDDERFRDLLEHARASAAPRPEAASLMIELLRIRVGDDAAERWRTAYQRLLAPTPP
jgi:tetratricopeptide (TPR) repeat protein